MSNPETAGRSNSCLAAEAFVKDAAAEKEWDSVVVPESFFGSDVNERIAIT